MSDARSGRAASTDRGPRDEDRPHESAGRDALREAYVALLGAERRLRGREGGRPDALSLAHFRLLLRLLDEDRIPAGRLAAAADLAPASATQMLDLLEKRGMVVRERDVGDRRVVLVRLTDEGRLLTQERRDSFRTLWNETLAGLDEEQLAGGLAVLERIHVFLEELTERKAT